MNLEEKEHIMLESCGIKMEDIYRENMAEKGGIQREINSCLVGYWK